MKAPAAAVRSAATPVLSAALRGAGEGLGLGVSAGEGEEEAAGSSVGVLVAVAAGAAAASAPVAVLFPAAAVATAAVAAGDQKAEASGNVGQNGPKCIVQCIVIVILLFPHLAQCSYNKNRIDTQMDCSGKDS
jgi:hypothetical protein